jgi:hypothetical protein
MGPIMCRLEKLWRSSYTKADYFEFLSENGWVWLNHRWWMDIMDDFPEIFDGHWVCPALLSDSEMSTTSEDEMTDNETVL